jgi:uncharacterized protein
MELPGLAFAYLLPAAFIAGVIDAIGGGGGLITVPVLLASGLPPHLALGTNKGQSVFGSSTALVRFARAGLVDRQRARVTFPAGLLGASVGVALAIVASPSVLRPIVLVLLVLAALALVLAPRGAAPRVAQTHARKRAIAAAIACVIGAYDGFFGPGAGAFLITLFVLLLGSEITHASADAKVVNFASNLASVIAFGANGLIAWHVALPMAAAQFAGSWLGAQLAIRGGERFVRLTVLVVVTLLVAKLALDSLA